MNEQVYFEQFVGDVPKPQPIYIVSCYGEITQWLSLDDAIAKRNSYRPDCYPTLYMV